MFPEVGLVVQLVRMPPCHGGGRGFESRPVRKRDDLRIIPFLLIELQIQKPSVETPDFFACYCKTTHTNAHMRAPYDVSTSRLLLLIILRNVFEVDMTIIYEYAPIRSHRFVDTAA